MKLNITETYMIPIKMITMHQNLILKQMSFHHFYLMMLSLQNRLTYYIFLYQKKSGIDAQCYFLIGKKFSK